MRPVVEKSNLLFFRSLEKFLFSLLFAFPRSFLCCSLNLPFVKVDKVAFFFCFIYAFTSRLCMWQKKTFFVFISFFERKKIERDRKRMKKRNEERKTQLWRTSKKQVPKKFQRCFLSFKQEQRPLQIFVFNFLTFSLVVFNFCCNCTSAFHWYVFLSFLFLSFVFMKSVVWLLIIEWRNTER